MKNLKTSLANSLVFAIALVGVLGNPADSRAAPAQVPLFLGGGQPLVMLTMSRDHKLYYEAYNDNSDLNGDGILDTGYKPNMLNPDGSAFSYYGYFDSFKCYDWDGTNKRFVPAATTTTKKCSSKWSGDFLNYLTMTRMDAMRKVLYGGFRKTDDTGLTVLERSYVPQDAHSWGKEYESLARDGYLITDYTPLSQPTSGKRHLFANTTLLSPGSGNGGPLLRVLQNSDYRIWEWVSIERPVAGDKCLHGSSGPNCGTITDYQVRIEVCKTNLLESDCRGYPRGAATPTAYKPSGLLHEFGEDGSMGFGLLTGSYSHNLQGGVLRKNIENFANEIDSTTGQFTTTQGIVKTLDALAITGFGGNYEYSCGWIVDRPLNDGECKMWGNPIAEMMYEGLRYFAGESGPTSDYTYSGSNDDGLALPKPAWQNPYRLATGGYGWCSKPFQMVISDINPSFDSQVPGTAFGSASGSLSGKNLVTGSSASLNASALGDTMWANESEGTNVFIGHSLAAQAPGVQNYDGAPTAKTINSFGNIRGLAPEEPTKQGTYYSASVGYFGNINRITNPEGQTLDSRKQNVQTFSVALASPLPKIEIPITALSKVITIVPFAKSVGGGAGGPTISANYGDFQPTNQIVDFYVDTIRNVPGFPTDAAINGGRPYYKFRINYEDVEQGADHDMDAIAEYTISLLAGDVLEVKVDSRYAAGSIAQHMGYVISGTNTDGTYLVVRDCDTANTANASPCVAGGANPGTDPDYFLDRPNTAGVALPLTSTNTFTAGAASAAFMKHDPLWYAAKWGGFTDASTSRDSLPSLVTEWDKKDAFGGTGQDGNPDNYFLVTNAGRLKDQLRAAFSEIAARTTSASAIAQNSTRLDTDTMIYQARFNTQDWTGELRAFSIETDGTVNSTPAWEASSRMPLHGSRKIFAWDAATKSANQFVVFSSPGTGELTSSQLTALNLGGSTTRAVQKNFVDYLRGDSTLEQRNGGIFRNRSVPLGDIINSDPIYVYAEDFGYEALPESVPAVATDPNIYATYRDVTKPARRKMIYVSSNDGIVHGFDASNDALTGGVEQFAFVPGAALSQMKELAQPGYTHQYIVDGPLFAGDAFLALNGATVGSWKSVLLGTTGAGSGGKSVFALDVTAPDSFSASNVMWEFTNTDDASLGYPMGQPVIGRMPNGRWAAIFGNGWESTAGTAKLIIAYLDPVISSTSASPGWTLNTDYCVLNTDSTTSNGLGSPSLLDTNGDGVVDYIYAGDLQGNVWRFRLNATSGNCPSGWAMEKKLFQAPTQTCKVRDVPTGNVSNCTSPTTKRQPITGQLEIAGPPAGQSSGYMVFFGTGQYYAQNDPIDMTQQSFYAIWDDLSTSGTATTAKVVLSDLVRQTINTEGTITVPDANNPTGPQLTYDYRTTSANAVPYTSKKGWYMDLLKPNPDAANPQYQGERVVSTPLLRGGRVVFTTLVPSSDSCAFGGDSWVMEVDLSTGGYTSSPSFDINNDRSFSSLDRTSSGAVISGIKSTEGIIKTPAVISAGGVEYKYASGTSGNIQKIVEKGTAAVKRTSWRQLQ